MHPKEKKYSLGILLFLCVVGIMMGCGEEVTTVSYNPSDGTDSPNQNPSIIDLSAERQIIRGFGAANILPWRPDMTDSDIELAFGTGVGRLGFSILRLMVQENPDRWDINVPTAKKAYDRGVKIFAAPWNAPDELLEPGDGPDTLAHDHYDEYADHLNSYNTFMENNGVDLYGMSIQNEPDHGSTWTGWTPDELLTFMKDHASAIDTRIIAPESFQFRRNVSDPLLNDEQAREELDIVGGHIYGGGLEPYPLAKSLGKEVWMTEHLDTTTTYNAVLATGKEIHDCLAVADFNAYVWWYIKRFYGPTSEDGDVSKRGYVMSHYSRFIRPGYHRIDATQNPQTDIFVSAYTGEDKTVIVALNMGSESVNQQFVTENGDDAISSFTPHVTTSDENVSEKEPVSLSSDGSSFEFEIPAQSIVTFVGD